MRGYGRVSYTLNRHLENLAVSRWADQSEGSIRFMPIYGKSCWSGRWENSGEFIRPRRGKSGREALKYENNRKLAFSIDKRAANNRFGINNWSINGQSQIFSWKYRNIQIIISTSNTGHTFGRVYLVEARFYSVVGVPHSRHISSVDRTCDVSLSSRWVKYLLLKAVLMIKKISIKLSIYWLISLRPAYLAANRQNYRILYKTG